MSELASTQTAPLEVNSASPIITRIFRGLEGVSGRNKLALLIGIPILIAVLSSALLWSRDATYKVLFSNVSDADGGAIIAALTQMNVPYRHSDNGNAILVPMDKVHDARLKLASQGLPKGSVVGFELLENQKLGITQFQEQVNYQRALEGELARSISSMGSVNRARVHLAIPKPSIFLRDQQKPTASVVLNLHGGRVLDKTQIQGIVHLVASSVPDLSPKNVSIVDQTGSLLTSNANDNALMDATQATYVQTLENNYAKRVSDILVPIFGEDNIRATVTADVDFSQTENTEETYKPNADPTASAIRSQQTTENSSGTPANPQGVPGTLSNQPPGAATAPIGANPQAGLPSGNGQASAAPTSSSKNSTVNYEVDKSVKYTKAQVGVIKRLSAAVVVNNKNILGPKGESKSVALSPEEIEQIRSLVREAVGFNKDRGDTVNVVNQIFTKTEEKPIPLWQNQDVMDLAKSFGLPLGVAAVAALLIFGLFKPMLQTKAGGAENGGDLLPSGERLSTVVGEDDREMLAQIANEEETNRKKARMEELRRLAKDNPQLVASIVKNWVTGE
ncbi:MAG: flagellar basal-body MS-ring/collar protein FliF [Burkholderiaceae bacterium]|jgi:flagellar M-ring protein FliF